MNIRTVLAVATAFAAATCGTAPGGTATTSITVDSIPLFDLFDRSASETQLFEYPSSGTRLSNGNIVVNDYYAAKVLYFDSTGRLFRTIGGHGKGPGEFGRATVWFGQCAPDSTFVLLFDLMKVAVIDSAGNTRRTYAMDQQRGFPQCQRDGRSLFRVSNMKRIPRAGDPPLRIELFVGDVEGDDVRSIGEFVLGDYGPLRPTTSAVLRNDRIYIGPGESGVVDVYSDKGKKLGTLETGAKQQRATEAHYEAALDQFVTYLVLRDDRIQMKQFFRERYPKPSQTPAYRKIFIDPDDMLWALTSPPGENTVLRVVSAKDGSPAGVMTLPVELAIFEIGTDHILGYFEDEEGFPHVAMYRIRRR